MRVEEIMIRDVATCSPGSDLASVAMTMWNRDCGSVAVTDDEGRPVGMITDRDISIAGATQHRPLADIPVYNVKDNHVISGETDQDIRDALSLMAAARVRRLPIVDDAGRLAGVLSMGDIVAALADKSDAELASEDVIDALREVYVTH